MNAIKQYWGELDTTDKIFFIFVFTLISFFLYAVCNAMYLRYTYPEAFNQQYMITEIHKEFPNGIVYESNKSYTFYVVDDHKLYFVKNMSAKSPKVTSVKEAKQLSPF